MLTDAKAAVAIETAAERKARPFNTLLDAGNPVPTAVLVWVADWGLLLC